MTKSITTSKTVHLFSSTSSQLAARLGMPLKPSVILLRWPVVIICAYLLLYPAVDYLSPALSQIFIILYVVSNIALYFIREEKFVTWSFYYPLVVSDTMVLTVSLISNGYAETNFYIAFFLVIIVSCIVDDAKLRAVGSILASLIYAALLLQTAAIIHPSAFLRTPFLFVVALYYGYFTQFTRTEKNMRQEAEQRSRGQKEILDILSHELRTPLSVISGYAQALQNGTLGAVSPKQDSAFSGIIRQSNNLLTLVTSLIDFTRIQSSELSFNQEDIDLKEYLDELRVNYDYALESRVTMSWSISPDLPIMKSDKQRLAIVLKNLINNAIKFTQEGEIRIFAGCSPDRKTFEFEVADSGIGISKSELPLIFDKFHQADRTSSRSYDGLGLGLHIVKAFTDVAGGKIEVESAINRGSTFKLSLPI
jgi:signal transduction histidine kinase